MHVTRVLIQEHVLIKQVLHLMDRSRQALDAGSTDNITVIIYGFSTGDSEAFGLPAGSGCPSAG
jgi:hypothetical protein